MKRKHILYRDVADKLKEDIMSGRYPIGSFLPTETELEATFNVSKITVRKAIELLAADEYVETQRTWDDGFKQSPLQQAVKRHDV